MTVKSNVLAQQILEVIPWTMRTVAAELRRTGHTLAPSHFRLLAILNHHACSLTELAEMQAVSLPTMSNSITRLVERGWVQRTQSSHDRRKVLIALTPDGQAVLRDMRCKVAAYLTEALSPLSPADRDVLLAGLAILQRTFAARTVHAEGIGKDVTDVELFSELIEAGKLS